MTEVTLLNSGQPQGGERLSKSSLITLTQIGALAHRLYHAQGIAGQRLTEFPGRGDKPRQPPRRHTADYRQQHFEHRMRAARFSTRTYAVRRFCINVCPCKPTAAYSSTSTERPLSFGRIAPS